jgi:chemotaxis signal transduction protein
MEQSNSNSAVASVPSQPELSADQLTEELSESVTRYVVVEINHNLYGMSTDTTVELMSGSMTQVTRVPHSPNYISGVINHRGTIIPVIDMRSLFGFDPRETETEKMGKMFQELKDDHVQWLSALQDSIYTSAAFSKPTDPTKCNFGKWYQSIQDGSSSLSDMTESDPVLKSLIERFDEPHRKIHALAEEVLKLKEAGDVESATEMVSAARANELAEMCDLFDQVLVAVSSKLEMMLVITEIGSRKAAIAVDGVSFVVDCNNDSIETLPDTAENTEFLSGLVHQSDGSYILIADLEHIYNIACPLE